MLEYLIPLHPKHRSRWEYLLWFARALVYHKREEIERKELGRYILSTLNQAEKPEAEIMGRTISEEIREESELKGYAIRILVGKQTAILRLLRQRFQMIRPEMQADLEATQDSQLSDDWLDAIVSAKNENDLTFQVNQKPRK